MKALRRLLALVVVLGAIFFGGRYALTPTEEVKASEALSEVNATTNLEDLNQDLINNVSFNNSRLTTTLNIDNNTFLSLLKNGTEGYSQIQAGSYTLVGDHIEAKIPVTVAGMTTQVATNIKVTGASNSLNLVLDDAKVGKIPVPNFALEQVLKQALSGSGASGVSVNGNTITLSSSILGIPANIDSVDLSGGNIHLTASLSNSQLLQYGSQALRGFLGGGN